MTEDPRVMISLNISPPWRKILAVCAKVGKVTADHARISHCMEWAALPSLRDSHLVQATTSQQLLVPTYHE